MKLLVCAGGTGGGIYPALTAVHQLEQEGLPREDILWVGTKGEMEEQLVPRAGYSLQTIAGGAIAGVSWPQKVRNGSKLLWSISKAWRILRRFPADVMLMTGGYMSFPFTIASWLRGVPITIFLPDVEPGQSIRFATRFACRIGASLPGSSAFVPPEKLVVTGYPVRPELQAAAGMPREEALAQFDLQPDRQTVLIFGGSRGAWAINKALMGILPQLLETAQVIHISGTLTWTQVESYASGLTAAQKQYYRPFPYLHEEMGAAYRAADLVVARAGASMLGECPAFSLPAVLVPLAWAWRYQKINADFLSEHGAAIQLTDEQLEKKLLPTLQTILSDPQQMAQMRQAAQQLANQNGAVNLAGLIKAVALREIQC